ncbi:response regulator [Rubellimicrobium rubrum]|uniref:Response regulator n=2 Tax=Rubellimicrobium rubrum TaxID=2585369 RepID=A0A5C4MPE8_9RHOB|nr:response regulator [Rubellimicrobium rubrum]
MVVAKALGRLRPDWLLMEATDADDALARVKEQAVHVALIDFNMPGTDGLSLAADLRKLWPAMPIAIISANVQDEIIARARALDATFVPKPLTDDALGSFLSGATLRLRRGAA